MPAPLSDVYRDMRDRRLIVPALGLLAAIAAVPVALRADSEPAPEPRPPVLTDGATAVEPAVLAEDLSGVRDYRKRLNQLKSSNPFASELETLPKKPGAGAPEGAGSPGPSPEPPPSTPNPAPSGGGGESQPGVVVEPIGIDPPKPVEEQELLILAPRVDLKVVRGGVEREMKDVAIGDLVPKKGGSLALLGTVSDDLKRVQFLIFDGYSSFGGEGQCRPQNSNCDLLTLRDGQRHTFTRDATGGKVAIKVTNISEEIVDRRKVADGR